MSNLGHDTAATIVETDTLALIAEADSVVQSCTGPNCNVSQDIRNTINQNVSQLAQEQSNLTLSALSIPSSSVLGRQIYTAYVNLGAAVASVYNFQCGDTITNSTTCVLNASSVQTAQNNLQSLLNQPTQNEINHLIILSILAIIALIAFILFFIFLIIGLFEKMFEAPEAGAEYMSHIQQLSTQPNQQIQSYSQSKNPSILQVQSEKIPVPASPFDTTEPIYE